MTLELKKIESGGKVYYGFQKGKDVKLLDNFQFDSEETSMNYVYKGSGEETKGFEISLGYYRSFESENALLVVTLLDLDKEIYENYDI